MALTQWLPVSRRGGGEWNTGNIVIPEGIDKCHIVLDVVPSQFSTPNLSVTATVEVSFDNAVTWEEQMVVGWVGGPPSGRSGTWYAIINGLSTMTGKLALVHFSTSGTFRWGLLGEIS